MQNLQTLAVEARVVVVAPNPYVADLGISEPRRTQDPRRTAMAARLKRREHISATNVNALLSEVEIRRLGALAKRTSAL